MVSLTLKQLDPELLERLKDQAKKRGLSLNAFVRELLARAIGLTPGTPTYTDLSELAGSWTEADEREFLEDTRPFREIDKDLWR